MRAYKLFATVATLALVAGCADGKDGADGAAGAKGDKGEAGEAGTDGTNGSNGTNGTNGDSGAAGEDGQDAACAAFDKLAIKSVIGVADPVFPGAPLDFELDLDGGSPDVNVQFIGTMSFLGGTATIPALPTAGPANNAFSVTPATEGDITYVAIATDGCTVATTTFTVKVRAALVSFVDLYPGLDDIGFALRGDSNPLFQVVNSFFGPIAVATIGPGGAFPGYFRLAQTDLDVDMFPDADGDGVPDLDGTPNRLPKIVLEPDSRLVIVAYEDAGGNLAWAVLKPDQSVVDGDVEARVQFAHLAGGAGTVDVASDEAMTTQIFSNATIGTLSAPKLLAPLDTAIFIDATEDGKPEFEGTLPLESGQVLPGDYVIVMAWFDAANKLQLFVHDTGGDNTQYAGGIFPFPAEVFPYLGPPDVRGTFATPTSAIDDVISVDINVVAAADCAVKNLVVKYAMSTEGSTYGTDIDFTVTSPGGVTKAIGSGKNAGSDADVGKIDVSAAFAYEAVSGVWTVEVSDSYVDEEGFTVNSIELNFYCGEPLGAPDKVVTVTPALAIPDTDTPVTSTATVSGACTVKLVTVDWALTHRYSPDIDFSLKSPSGADYVFLGSPTSSLDETGSYGPVTGFDGDNGTGIWTLEVVDTGAGDAGTLDSWTLKVYCE